MYKTGIIVELKEKEAIVFNNLCEYEKVRRVQGMFEGQMIEYKKPISYTSQRYIWTISKVAVIAVLILMSYFIYIQNTKSEVFAYVDLDTNCSIAFSIDRQNRIVGVKPLSYDAKKVVKYEELKGMNISKAVSYVISKLSKDATSLSEKEDVILISSTLNVSQKDNAKDSLKLDAIVQELRQTILHETRGEVPIKSIYVNASIRNASSVINMSMGRYALYSSAVNHGSNITIEEAKAAPLKKLIAYWPKESSDSKTQNSSGNASTNTGLPSAPQHKAPGGLPPAPQHGTPGGLSPVPQPKAPEGLSPVPQPKAPEGLPPAPQHKAPGGLPPAPQHGAPGGLPPAPQHGAPGGLPPAPQHGTPGGLPPAPQHGAPGKLPPAPQHGAPGKSPPVPQHGKP